MMNKEGEDVRWPLQNGGQWTAKQYQAASSTGVAAQPSQSPLYMPTCGGYPKQYGFHDNAPTAPAATSSAPSNINK